jgi:glucose-1-phosphate thymidylyltransferase
MKGIILAGGNGSRLFPSTKVSSKHLLPVYDKPLIYYSLSTLILSNIYDICIISTQESIFHYKKLLNNLRFLGIKLTFLIQKKPKGIPDAFNLAKKFIGTDDVCLVLGDNVLYGAGLQDLLLSAKKKCIESKSAFCFTYKVKNPFDYGVLNFNKNNKVTSIEEKPLKPKSDNAIIGLYYFPNSVIKEVKKIKMSLRGELEIIDLLKIFIKKNKFIFHDLGRGIAWFDTGTAKSLIDASNFVYAIQERQGYKIACIEEIALKEKLINKNDLRSILKLYPSSEYKKYLIELCH